MKLEHHILIFLSIIWIQYNIQVVNCDINVELKLLSYSNKHGLRNDKQCCDHGKNCSSNPCDPEITGCLSAIINSANCDIGRFTTKQYIDQNEIVFSRTLGLNIINPIIFTYENEWKDSINIQINIKDIDEGNSHDIIDNFHDEIRSAKVYPNKPAADILSRQLHGKVSEFKYSIRIYCSDNYYGKSCNTFCQSVDRQRYACDNNGQKVCNVNWYSANCDKFCEEKDIDKIGHYNCDVKGDKVCLRNWYGENCTVHCNDDNVSTYKCGAQGQKICSQFWYSSQCNVFCDSNLLDGGHYVCASLTGEKVCLKNWYGKNCTIFCEEQISSKYICNSYTGEKRCLPYYYGKDCDRYCKEENEKNYTCNELGEKRCHQHFYGNDCSVYVPRLPSSEATCVASGSLFYKSFDGHTFTFSGGCTYQLAADCIDNMFAIHLFTEPSCMSLSASCEQSVNIYFGIVNIKLQKDFVIVNNKTISLPYVFKNIIFERAGYNYVVISGWPGVSIRWDGTSVYINLEAVYANRTCGLCGNFNGNPRDDFTSSQGDMKSSPQTFANSWKRLRLGEVCSKSNSHFGYSNAVVNRYNQLTTIDQNKVTQVCSILHSQSFQLCKGSVNPDPYFTQCLEDVADCSTSFSVNCSCKALTEYSKACAEKKIVLEWRSQSLCYRSCPGKMVYSECGIRCPKTCKTMHQQILCRGKCLDGCVCPPDMILHNNTCILGSDCPCTHNGKVYDKGDSIRKDCNRCICSSGQWNCTKNSCSGTCSTFGDPHYKTFDGKWFNFNGICKYILAQDWETNLFKVITENIACNAAKDVSCAKSVTVVLNGSLISLNRGMKASVGKKPVLLPYVGPGVLIRKVSSMFLKVSTAIGLEILFDGSSRIYVTVPPQFRNKTRGLCGTFNLNQQDDFMTPEGIVNRNELAFGNSWKFDADCKAVIETPYPCDLQTQKEPVARKKCNKLLLSHFSACHNVVLPDQYVDACIFDVCGCTDGVECLCNAVAAYTKACADNGVIIDWRNEDILPECAISCSTGRMYQECGNICHNKCEDLATQEKCESKCVAGCNCPNGTLENEFGSCVDISQCSCYHQGNTYAAGYVVYREKCKKCICNGGELKCEIDQLCGASKCPGNQVWSGVGVECSQTCETLHVPCFNQLATAGCHCPNSTVWDSVHGKCVVASSCPCHYNGRAYSNGETYSWDCNTCTCDNNKWSCTANLCPGTCSIYGDPHYTTYDGKRYMFEGRCDYVISQDFCNGQNGTFRIQAENVPCGNSGSTCTKSISVTIEDTTLHLQKDQQMTALPAAGHDMMTAKYDVIKSHFFEIIHSAIGVTVVWDRGTRILISLHPRYKGLTCGLCGNFNDDQNDDFTTEELDVVVNAASFGDSWKVNDRCPDTKPTVHPCTIHKQRAPWSHKQCNVINRDNFKPCHSVVNPHPYFDACYHDACGCDMGGDCECLCTAISAYVEACNAQGVHIKWRSQELCPIQCEKCQEYKACGPSNPETCKNLCTNTKIVLPVKCVEGCFCANNTILHNGKCIKQSECPCFHDNMEYKPGSFIIMNCQQCTCKDGCLQCSGQKCTSTALPPTTMTTQSTTGSTIGTSPTTSSTSTMTESSTTSKIPTTSASTSTEASTKQTTDTSSTTTSTESPTTTTATTTTTAPESTHSTKPSSSLPTTASRNTSSSTTHFKTSSTPETNTPTTSTTTPTTDSTTAKRSSTSSTTPKTSRSTSSITTSKMTNGTTISNPSTSSSTMSSSTTQESSTSSSTTSKSSTLSSTTSKASTSSSTTTKAGTTSSTTPKSSTSSSTAVKSSTSSSTTPKSSTSSSTTLKSSTSSSTTPKSSTSSSTTLKSSTSSGTKPKSTTSSGTKPKSTTSSSTTLSSTTSRTSSMTTSAPEKISTPSPVTSTQSSTKKKSSTTAKSTSKGTSTTMGTTLSTRQATTLIRQCKIGNEVGYECKNAPKFCIERGRLCDGVFNCPEFEDEENCPTKPPAPTTTPWSGTTLFTPKSTTPTTPRVCDGFLCVSRFCLRRDMVCDGEPDCPDKEDEANCPTTISTSTSTSKMTTTKPSTPMSSSSTSTSSTVLSTTSSTVPSTTTTSSTSTTTSSTTTSTTKISSTVPSTTLTSTTKPSTTTSSTLKPSTATTTKATTNCILSPYKFHCADKSYCLNSTQVCDYNVDCRDGSDENGCPPSCKGCSKFEFKCHKTCQCLPVEYVCDEKNDCLDSSDELGCPSITTTSRPTIPTTGTTSTVLPLCPNNKIYRNCVRNCQQKCAYLLHKCIEEHRICQPGCGCPDGLVRNGTFCVLPSACPCYDPVTQQYYRVEQSWNRTCEKCSCFNNAINCAKIDCVIPYCPPPTTLKTKFGDCCPTCVAGTFPPTTSVTTTKPSCLLSEFLCGNGQCIPTQWVCDGERDCYNADDERNCPTTKPFCYGPIGISNPNIIKGEWFESSSYRLSILGPVFQPSFARLNHREKIGNAGAWCADIYKPEPHWISVDLQQIFTITKIAVQSRSGAITFLKHFKLQYSITGYDFKYYKMHGYIKIFQGNRRVEKIEYRKLEHPIQARAIKIEVLHYYGRPCLRFELYGCLNTSLTTTPPPTTTIATTTFKPTTVCPEFECENKECIKNQLACNGVPNCADGSDEFRCNRTCSPQEFTCDSGQCTLTVNVCDGDPDCGDGSDELTCPNRTCTPSQFTCPSGRCIYRRDVCDGEKDCPSGADEKNCTTTTTTTSTTTSTISTTLVPCDGYICQSSKNCIKKHWLCDNVKDCMNGEDETCCTDQHFHCPTSIGSKLGKCIESRFVCDKYADCDDGFDEKNCPNKTTTQTPITTTTSSTTIIKTNLVTESTVSTLTGGVKRSTSTTKTTTMCPRNSTCLCINSCESLAKDALGCDRLQCIDECSCPQNFIYNNKTGHCYQKLNCPCVHDGRVFVTGDVVKEVDCTRCLCTPTGIKCSKFCDKSSCPKGHLLYYPPNGCCKCIKQLVCRSDQILSSCACPVTCDMKTNATCTPRNCKEGCTCPAGQYDNGTHCVDVNECYCTDKDGVIRSPNSYWKSGECQECRCSSGQISCGFLCKYTTCPVNFELVKPKNECCICVPTKTTTSTTTASTTFTTTATTPFTTTQIVTNGTVTPLKECQLFERNVPYTDPDTNCRSEYPLTKSLCLGVCNSSVTSDFVYGYGISRCACCKPSGLYNVTVSLKCPTGEKKSFTYRRFQACFCQPCDQSPFLDVPLLKKKP